MKKAVIFFWLLLAICLPAAAEEVDLAPLLGTWTNPEYNPTDKTPKIVFKADGTGGQYQLTNAEVPSYTWTYTVEEAWQDAEGARWYKIVAVKIQTLEERFWYLLIRISPDGKTYEEDHLGTNRREYPARIDPESYFYKVFYRQ